MHINKNLLYNKLEKFINEKYNTAMQIITFIVDAFTNKPFSGNPAGVCLIETDIDESLMQLNISETTFLYKRTK